MDKGFSLIELMIAVAILGILAAISIPAYQHQVNVSHQKEAKALLAQLDSSMKTFFAEYACWTSNFDAMGFNPDGTLYYVVGFAGAGQNPTMPTVPYLGHTTCTNTVSALVPGNCGGVGPWQYNPKWLNNPNTTSIGTGLSSQAASFTAAGWTAYAVANLNGTVNDVWSMDSSDNLVCVQNGL